MTLPNFLVIGAGRSGTTSLHHYLQQHTDVFVPDRKSPSYFYCLDAAASMSFERRLETRSYFVADARAYEALFDGAGGRRAIGEVSPVYLASTRVASRIAERLPNVRLVAVLRNPIDRLHARFVARRRDGLERMPDLASVVRRERLGTLVRDDASGTYLAAGFVSHVLQTYLDRFSRQRLRLYLFEDLQEDPGGLLRDLFAFLGVDPELPVDTTARHNRSGGVIGNPVLRFGWTRSALLRTWARPHVPAAIRDRAFSFFARRLTAQPIDDALYRELAEIYRGEVETLQRMLGRDLSYWLACPASVAATQSKP